MKISSLKTNNIVLVLLLLILSVFLNYIPTANAGGGVSFPAGTFYTPTWVAVAAAATGSTAAITNVIHNDWIIVVVAFTGTGQTVKAGGVTDTGTTSYSNTANSDNSQDAEIWCGQYTAASGSDTVTVKSTASATYDFTVWIMGGITSCTEDTGATNHGTTAAMSVGSFTPTTGDDCVVIGSENTGAVATFTDAVPFLFDYNGGTSAPPTSAVFSTHNYAVSVTRGSWNSNDGATTATLTASASSSPTWDEVIACFPTTASGNEIYDSGIRGGGRGAGTPQTAGVNAILKGDYMVALGSVGGTSSGVTSVTNGNGADSFSLVNKVGVHDDTEAWIAKATQNSPGGGLTMTFNFAAGSPGSVINSIDIGGISSTTPEIYTNSGTATTISLTSFTPDAGDLCIEQASINNANALTFSVAANQPFQLGSSGASSGSGYTHFYQVEYARANWPAGVSTTGSITVTGSSSPTWDVQVLCFPGNFSAVLNSGLTLTSSISQALGILVSDTTSIMPSIIANMYYTEFAAVSLSATINQALTVGAPPAGYLFGLTITLVGTLNQGMNEILASAISLGSSLNQNLGVTQYATLSLNTYLNQVLSITLNPTLSLFASLSAQTAAAYSATLYSIITLSASVDQDLSNSLSPVISLFGSLSAQTYAAYSEMLSVTTALSGSIDQDAANSITSAISLVTSLSTQTNAAYSEMLSATTALSGSIDQDVSNVISSTMSLLTSLSTQFQQGYSATLGATIGLVSSIDQDASIIINPITSLTASVFSNNVAYNVFLSIGISLSAALLNLGGANGTSGIIYDGWIILVFISGALSLLSLMALMNDRKHVGVALVILLIVASMLSFIAAVLSANLDFVVGANVTTYTGLYWAAVPLGAMGLVDALFALIAAMSMWHKIRVSKGY